MAVNPWANDEARVTNRTDPFGPRPVQQSTGPGANGKIDEAVLRATNTPDGGVADGSFSRVLRSSVHQAADAATHAANTPFDFALDERTKTRLQPHQLTENSIVSFGGTTVTVRDAVSLGWMKPLGGGSAPPPSSNEVAQAEEEPEQPSEPAVQPLPDVKAQEALEEIISNTGGIERSRATSEIIESGEITPETLSTLASHMGIEPEVLAEKFAPVLGAYEKAARSEIEKSGIPSQSVIDWAQEHQPKALKACMSLQASTGKTAAYAGLAQAYLEALADSDPQTALNANLGDGWSQHLDGKRVVVTSPDGTTMLWRSAMALRRR